MAFSIVQATVKFYQLESALPATAGSTGDVVVKQFMDCVKQTYPINPRLEIKDLMAFASGTVIIKEFFSFCEIIHS